MLHRVLIVVTLLSGCSLDAEDIKNWQHVSQGERRLSAYLADTARPMELRLLSARVLFEMGHLDHLMGVLAEALPEDREALARRYARVALAALDEGDAEMKGRAATLTFYLGPRLDLLTKEQADELVSRVVDLALAWSVSDDPPKARKAPDDLLLAMATVRPKLTLPKIYEHLKSLSSLRAVLSTNQLLLRLKDAEARRAAGAALLDFAQRRYPDVPAVLAEAMLQNGNETLLRFLLDAVADPRVPPSTRNLGLEAAEAHLKAKALPSLFKLLKLDDAGSNHAARFAALNMIWDFGGVERLAEALRALPEEAGWPEEGDSLKLEIEQFCIHRVAQKKDKALLVLETLLEEGGWPTRLYAVGCLLTLYPDDALPLLKPLSRDETPIKGWAEEEKTLGQIIREAS